MLLFVSLLYLLFAPVPIDPGNWIPPDPPKRTGVYATNSFLKNTKYFSFPCPICEDVAIDQQGNIYGGAEDGSIWKFTNEEEKPVLFGKVKGRPLGMIVNKKNELIVADANHGLFAFTTEGQLRRLVSGYNGIPFTFTNDMEIGHDGSIYFTNASNKFTLAKYKLDLMEHQPNGGLYVYDPETGKTKLLLDSLYFANGVAVSPEQDFVLVAETGKFRVKKLWLKGPQAGQSQVIIENLPGFPDGISTGTAGVFWIAIISPRNPLLDYLMDKPFWRKILPRLPDVLQPAPEKYATVLGIDAQGKIVHNLQDPDGTYSQITNVREANGKLYFGTLGEETLGFIEKP